MDNPTSSPKVQFIKILYLYVVSLVGLLMVVFSTADLLNIVLRTYVFTKADQNYYNYPEPACPTSPGAKDAPSCLSKEERKKIDADNRTAERQRDLVRNISFITVGVPLFLYHWRVARRKE
ncbi:MAG: hypothetical protein HY983_01540 [Candidatus Magasanikbacteria bacterium]|nr:hypothetical protein [Candidatus Magasanikbacteria bacterium]